MRDSHFIVSFSAICLLLMVAMLPMQQAVAQSGGLDVSPPEIEHESLVTGTAGDMQTFSVNVADDQGVRQVVLFYRSKSKSEYANVLMREVANLGKYSATVATKTDQDVIEYYIEASDTGGNRVLKGFPYYPLVRNLSKQETLTAQPVRPATPPAQVTNSDKKVLFIVLGILAAGALAAASDGSSGGSAELVPLNIGVTPP